MLKDNGKIKGIWTISCIDKNTGKIIETETIHNIIVDNGLSRIARLINGVSSTYFRAIGVGTGATGEVAGNTALEAEVIRAAATLTNGTYTAVFEYTFSFGSNYAITEAGLFDSVTVSGSTMLSRLTFAAKNVSATVQLIVSATITVERE